MKESGTFTGRSQLRLELIGIVVNGKLVPVVTGEYEVNGKSRGATREENGRRSVIGALIGAVADGGQGAAIGAGAAALLAQPRKSSPVAGPGRCRVRRCSISLSRMMSRYRTARPDCCNARKKPHPKSL